MLKEDINYKLFGNIVKDRTRSYSSDFTLSEILKIFASAKVRINQLKKLIKKFNNIVKNNNISISIDNEGYILYDSEETRIIFYLKYM